MEKTTTLNLRVNPIVKQNAEEVLSQIGIPMSTDFNDWQYSFCHYFVKYSRSRQCGFDDNRENPREIAERL